MLSKSDIKVLEKKYRFCLQKKLGQNFLIDANIKEKLITCAHIRRDDIVIEIGSGLGQLTFDLCRRAKKVIAVEYDKKLFSILSTLAADSANAVLVHEDFLKFNLKSFIPGNKRVKVISNLPYYISSPAILKLCAHRDYIESALLTMQKEVGARLTAGPSSKDYGSLTVFTGFHAEVEKLFNISRNCFYPIPQVDSTVISLNMRSDPPVSVHDRKDLFELVRAGFSMRRKTLVNAAFAQNYRSMTKEQLEEALIAAGIPTDARAETLALSDFAKIVNLI